MFPLSHLNRAKNQRDMLVIMFESLYHSKPTLQLHKILTPSNQITKLYHQIIQITKLHCQIIQMLNQVIKSHCQITEMPLIATKLHNTKISKHQHLLAKILPVTAKYLHLHEIITIFLVQNLRRNHLESLLLQSKVGLNFLRD